MLDMERQGIQGNFMKRQHTRGCLLQQ